jgi:hypothetical protein
MRRNLALLVGSLALGLVGLALILGARPGNASAPPAGKEAAEAGPHIAASRISHVTIYPDSALITRDVEVPAGQGLIELVISPLPEATMPSTLYTESADGVGVLTTRFRSRPVKEDTREEVRKVEEEIKKLQVQQRRLQAEVKALDANLALMGNLEKFTAASTVSATEKGKLDSEAAIALSKYLMEGRAEKSKQLVELNEQMLTNSEQMTFAQRRLNDLTSGTAKIERDAVLVVDKVNAPAAKVKLNYLVAAAAWRPQYKFRAGKTAKDAVTVEYLAAVVQHTGEDWERVEVTLSTAQPMLNAAPPELHALAVAVVPRGAPMPGVSVGGLQVGLQLGGMGAGALGAGGRPMGGPGSSPNAPFDAQTTNLPARLALQNPMGNTTSKELDKVAKDLRKRAQETANLNNDRIASELTNYAAVLEQARDLTLVQAAQAKRTEGGKPRAASTGNEGPSVIYHLAAKLSVPSRKDDQVIEVTRLELEPDYFYKAVPVLTPHVYRQAQLVNKSKYVLLPGEATMYNVTDFVGRMALPLVAIGEEFTAGFGAEPQLQVQRQLLERTRAMQAGNQVLKYEYRILITSYKADKVRMQVWDRLPHAEKEAMGVSLVKTTPALCKDPVYEREDRPNNLLRWDVEVEPDMKGDKAHKIQYEFQLELDRQATLGSFQTK